MTENEASVILNAELIHHSEVSIFYEALSKAIKALEVVQQYRQIGTVEECREAVEKQIAKKVKSISPVKDGDSYVGLIGRCPCCGDILEEDTVYCDCGQRLDWSDEE